MSGYVFAETDKLEQIGNALRTTSGSTQTYNISQLSETAAAAISSGNVVTYPLPIANATELGGVMPVAKTDEMTTPVGVDSNGKLYAAVSEIEIAYPMTVDKGGTGATDAETARTNLGITLSNIGAAASTHDHGAGDIISGTLTVAQGGTGITANPSMLINLGSTVAASVFDTSPRPGVTGTLPISNGGTGKTTAADARSALGANNASNLTSGTVAAARLPFKYQYGTINVTSSWSTISLTAGFTANPVVLATHTSDAASSGIEVIKTRNVSKTSFEICQAGSNNTSRAICWLAFGV